MVCQYGSGQHGTNQSFKAGSECAYKMTYDTMDSGYLEYSKQICYMNLQKKSAFKANLMIGKLPFSYSLNLYKTITGFNNSEG